MNSDTLANFGVVTDFYGGVLVAEFQILRNDTNACSGENIAVFANSGSGIEHCIGVDMATVANDDIWVNNRKGIDAYVLTNLSIERDRSEVRDHSALSLIT